MSLLTDPARRLWSLVGRGAVVCLLMPVVLLIGVGAVVGLVLSGVAVALRRSASSMREQAAAGAAELPAYSLATAEATDGLVAGRAA